MQICVKRSSPGLVHPLCDIYGCIESPHDVVARAKKIETKTRLACEACELMALRKESFQ